MKKLWMILLLCLCLVMAACNQTTPQTPDGTGAPDQQTDNTPAGQCVQHVDQQNDGRCDVCDVIVVVAIDFYGINDLHGKVEDGENHPGVDELTTYLKREMELNEHVVLLSVGDMWQGAAESNLTHGLIVTDWMNEMGFSAMTMGNHEYDWGAEPILANHEQAEFPFLAINVYDRSTDARVEYCQPSTVVERGGIQIGIIGAIGDCYSSIAVDKVSDIYFKTGSELTRLVKAESERLRSEGVDYIVYVIHDGYERSTGNSVSNVHGGQLDYYYDIELSDGYVDLVFEGHTHQRYILKDEYGVYHLQAGGDNKGITHAEISVNTANGKTKTRMTELVATGTYANMEDDPIVDDLLEKYDAQVSISKEVLGTNAKQRSSWELCQIAAQLYYEKGLELWGEEYDIVLGGGFFSVRSPYELPAGDVTYGQLQTLMPFDNNLVLCSIKGRDLQSKFFETDNDRYYIAYGEYGEQVRNNIDPNGTYYIVVDSYTSPYAPNRLTEIARLDEELYARDLLAQYIQQGGME